jgi:hypothetical protein
MLIYLKKNAYWQGKQVLSLTYCNALIFEKNRILEGYIFK